MSAGSRPHTLGPPRTMSSSASSSTGGSSSLSSARTMSHSPTRPDAWPVASSPSRVTRSRHSSTPSSRLGVLSRNVGAPRPASTSAVRPWSSAAHGVCGVSGVSGAREPDRLSRVTPVLELVVAPRVIPVAVRQALDDTPQGRDVTQAQECERVEQPGLGGDPWRVDRFLEPAHDAGRRVLDRSEARSAERSRPVGARRHLAPGNLDRVPRRRPRERAPAVRTVWRSRSEPAPPTRCPRRPPRVEELVHRGRTRRPGGEMLDEHRLLRLLLPGEDRRPQVEQVRAVQIEVQDGGQQGRGGPAGQQRQLIDEERDVRPEPLRREPELAEQGDRSGDGRLGVPRQSVHKRHEELVPDQDAGVGQFHQGLPDAPPGRLSRAPRLAVLLDQPQPPQQIRHAQHRHQRLVESRRGLQERQQIGRRSGTNRATSSSKAIGASTDLSVRDIRRRVQQPRNIVAQPRRYASPSGTGRSNRAIRGSERQAISSPSASIAQRVCADRRTNSAHQASPRAASRVATLGRCSGWPAVDQRRQSQRRTASRGVEDRTAASTRAQARRSGRPRKRKPPGSRRFVASVSPRNIAQPTSRYQVRAVRSSASSRPVRTSRRRRARAWVTSSSSSAITSTRRR